MSEFNEKASTPPDTATDAGRVGIGGVWNNSAGSSESAGREGKVVAMLKDTGEQVPLGVRLVLASDLDAVTVELMEQCRIVGMGAERELALQAKLDAVTAEREGWKLAYEKMKWIADVKRDKLTAVTAERDALRKRENMLSVNALVDKRTIQDISDWLEAANQVRDEACKERDALRRENDAMRHLIKAKDAMLTAKEQECEGLREAAQPIADLLRVNANGVRVLVFPTVEQVEALQAALATGGRHD